MAGVRRRTGRAALVFLAAVNILLLLLGAIMSLTSILVIFTPTLVGMATALGIDPVHLGVVVVHSVDEALAEVEAEIDGGDPQRLKDEIGDLLFCCVNLARKLEIDPEQALRHGNAKFERRFRRMEALLAEARRLVVDR